MVDPKPKRLRRSYLCGSCKLHKIKCDLASPCTPCVKFSRASQCLLDPAQPPSIEERQKADERRRKLRLKKSQDAQRKALTYETASLLHLPPSRPLQTQPRPAHNLILSPHNTLLASHNSLPQQPIQMPHGLAQTLQQPQPINGFAPLSLLYLLPHYIAHYLPSPAFTSQPQIAAPSQNLVPHGPTIVSYCPTIQRALSLPFSQPIMLLLSSVQRPPPSVEPISSNLSQVQPLSLSSKSILLQPLLQHHTTSHLPSIVGNPVEIRANPEIACNDHSRLENTSIKSEPSSVPPSIELLKSTASSVTENQSASSTTNVSEDPIGLVQCNDGVVEFSSLQIQQVLEVVPSADRCRVLMDFYYKADPLACIYDSPEYSVDLMLETASVLQLFASITKEAAKALSIVLVMLAVGELFADSDLAMADKRLKTALWIRDSIPSTSSINDTCYGVQFYFGLEVYYLWTQKLKESYLEFNRMLADILNSPDFLYAIQNRDDLGNLKALKLWLRVPGYLIEYLQFEANGTLFVTSKLKDAVIPHSRILKIAFEDEIFKRKDMTGFLINGWAAYYQELPPTIRLEEIVRRYMLLYSSIGRMTSKEASEVMAKFASGLSPEVTDQDIKSVVRHQVTMLIFVRWLLFIRVENSYFPSLRYASYLTSQVSMFNLYLSFKWSSNAIDIIADKCGILPLKHHIYSMMLQGLFMVVLRTFLHRKAPSFDLRAIFNKIKCDITSVHRTFHDLIIYQKTLKKIPYFKTSMKLVETLMELEKELQFSNDNLFDKFMEEMDRRIPNDSVLILTIFGLLDGFLRYMEMLFDLFSYLINREEDLKITDDLVLDGSLIEKYFDKFCGLELTPELIGRYITDVVRKSRGSTVLRPIDMR